MKALTDAELEVRTKRGNAEQSGNVLVAGMMVIATNNEALEPDMRHATHGVGCFNVKLDFPRAPGAGLSRDSHGDVCGRLIDPKRKRPARQMRSVPDLFEAPAISCTNLGR